MTEDKTPWEQTPASDPRPYEEPRKEDSRPTGAPPTNASPAGFSQNFAPPTTLAAKKTKKKKNALVITLSVLYVLLIAGVLALIATGNLHMGKTSSATQAPSGETAQKAPEVQNDPLVVQPAPEGTVQSPATAATQLYDNNVNSVVFVESTTRMGKATGSGFVIDAEHGYLLTNFHVVEGADDLSVTFKNGDSYTATLVGGDSINDVAVLQIAATGLVNVTIGNSDQVRIGEDVLVIGNPLGDLTFTLTKGVVSGINRSINTGEYNITTFQTDAAINSGNSGGPAFNAEGNVIGIASAKYAATGVEGLGFCIPINDAMAVAKDLVDYGYVKNRPNFGITVSTSSGLEISTDSFGRRVLTESVKGARVEEVAAGSCADKAGIRPGDIITKLEDTTITSANQLINAKNSYKAGDTIQLEIYRAGETIRVSATLDEYQP